MNIVIFGGPGSGKGTASEKITEYYKIDHISTGDMLREEISKKTDIGKKVESILADGKLVSDEIVNELIKNKIEKISNGAIFDGYPRTVKQAEKLTELLKEKGQKIDAVIKLDVADEIIIQRIINRELCPNKECGAIYNKKSKPSKVAGICDECGTKLITRADDNRETVQKRLDIYHKQVADIIDYYEKNKLLYTINPTEKTTPDEVFDKIQDYLKKI